MSTLRTALGGSGCGRNKGCGKGTQLQRCGPQELPPLGLCPTSFYPNQSGGSLRSLCRHKLKLSNIQLHFLMALHLSTYHLSIIFPSIYPSIYLSTISVYLLVIPIIYLPTYHLPIAYLFSLYIYLSSVYLALISIAIYLSTYLHITYLPTYHLFTYYLSVCPSICPLST